MRLDEMTVALPEAHVLTNTALTQQLQDRIDVAMLRYDTPDPARTATVFQPHGTPQFFGGLERFIAQIRQWQAAELCILVLCHSALEVRRMQELFASYNLMSRPIATCTACLADDVLRPAALLVSVGHLSQGFVWPEVGLVVLRHADIFGEKKQEKTPAAHRRTSFLNDFATLRPGEHVVHVDYGVGRYRGMTFLDVEHQGGEFMELEYADGAKLYVPSYRLSLVQKYTAGEGDNASLDRLGGRGMGAHQGTCQSCPLRHGCRPGASPRGASDASWL